MNAVVVDSCVVAKWILTEHDSDQALRLVDVAVKNGMQLVVLDLVFCEVANAIWKRQRQRLISPPESSQLLAQLQSAPLRVEPAVNWLAPALDIAGKYDRSIYDALFVALTRGFDVQGITADEPLVNSLGSNYPQVLLLRNWFATNTD